MFFIFKKKVFVWFQEIWNDSDIDENEKKLLEQIIFGRLKNLVIFIKNNKTSFIKAYL